MNHEIPKYHEALIPVLKILNEGGVMHYKELEKKVRDTFYGDLPQELLQQKTKTGHILILNRIGWARAYLKQAEMLFQPERAMVQITDKGRRILAKGSLTLKELKNDKDFLRNRKTTKESMEISESGTPQDLIDAGVHSIETDVKAELLKRLKEADPYYFEKVILDLLDKMGYGEPLGTPKSGDGGIDGVISQDKLGLDKIYIQAKRYGENKVRETDIRNFIGAMSRDANKGIFATTSSFDEKAQEKARDASQKIIMLDGQMLVDLMYKYGVGVQVKDKFEVKQVDEDFFESE